MVKGLYTAYSGLTVQQKRLDVVSNNLANELPQVIRKKALRHSRLKMFMASKLKMKLWAILIRISELESWSEGRRILQKLGSGLFPEHGQYI